MQIKQQNSTLNDHTKAEYDVIHHKVCITLKSYQNHQLDSSNYRYETTKVQLRCKPSLQNVILHQFRAFCHNDQICKMHLQEKICLKITRKFLLQNNENLKNEDNKIVQIDSQGLNHAFYLSALIRSVWQDKLNSKMHEKFQITDVIDACLLYFQQFQLSLEDLIEVFEAPLTEQYSRL